MKEVMSGQTGLIIISPMLVSQTGICIFSRSCIDTFVKESNGVLRKKKKTKIEKGFLGSMRERERVKKGV